MRFDIVYIFALNYVCYIVWYYSYNLNVQVQDSQKMRHQNLKRIKYSTVLLVKI